jgi:hypothetical protein
VPCAPAVGECLAMNMRRRAAAIRLAAACHAWRGVVVRAALLRHREQRLKAIASLTKMARAMRLWQQFCFEQSHMRILAAQLTQRCTRNQASPNHVSCRCTGYPWGCGGFQDKSYPVALKQFSSLQASTAFQGWREVTALRKKLRILGARLQRRLSKHCTVQVGGATAALSSLTLHVHSILAEACEVSGLRDIIVFKLRSACHAHQAL